MIDYNRSVTHYEYIKAIYLAWIKLKLYWTEELVHTKKDNLRGFCSKNI